MRDILEESDGSADAAIGYTNEFFDAAVEKIDAVFGKGYAKANPQLVGALVQASATNLSAFMQAASMLQDEMLSMMDELGTGFPEPARPPAAAPKSPAKKKGV
jgi:hypothetical protein